MPLTLGMGVVLSAALCPPHPITLRLLQQKIPHNLHEEPLYQGEHHSATMACREV